MEMEAGHHHHHRGALRRRGVAQQENAAADEHLGHGGDPGGVRQGKERPSDCNRCRICREPWASSGAHRICCIPCGHVYGRSCLEALLARCEGTAAKCLSCAREFKGKDMLNLHLQHTEEQMITTRQQDAPAARMQVPTEDQQEVAWQQTVAAMVAEAQQRAEMARRKAGLTREIEELARKEAITLKIMVVLLILTLLLLLIAGRILYRLLA